MITAPYNFVPLNKEVFYPEWSDTISHDVPFEDGESGMIDITITSESPIFIRNHYQDGDDFYKDKIGNKISKDFCNFKDSHGAKQYYIPGSSIKGMIRSMMEIMSFAKINVDEKTLKKPLSVRDMTQDKKTGIIFTRDMVATAKKCGFLIKEGDKYFIEDCGNVLTIRGSEIKKTINDYDKDLETAKDKYNVVGHIKLPFETEEKKDDNGKTTSIAVYNKNATKSTLVLTGFIDNKKNEFIFQTKENKIPLTETIYNNFKNVYFENKESIDGQYWKSLWENGDGQKIPIFYTEKQKQVSAIGLTQIFKLAYTKTLFNAINQKTDDAKLDLVETIFGTEKEKMALKGRVQFSHLKSTNVTFEKEKNEILGSPQPTYYPNYIRQTNVNGDKINRYITLMDNSSEISGYKRYPLHNGIKKTFIPDEEKKDIQTTFKPLDKNTVFKGKIRFHNLKKAEIGGLLSALTFHNNNQTHRHNLGMAKGLGYGKIKIDIVVNSLKYSQNEYLTKYETEMTIFKEDWIESVQLKELFATSNNNIKNDQNLIYQKLENPNTKDREKNDFTRAKKDKEYLQNYTSIGNVESISIESLIDKDEIKQEREERKEIEVQKKQAQQEIKKQELLDEQLSDKQQREEIKEKEEADKKANKEKLERDKETDEKAKVEQRLSSGIDFSNAQDYKGIERAIKGFEKTDKNIAILIECISNVYPDLNAKATKQFNTNSKEIVKWLGKDRLEELLKNIKQ